MKTTLEIAGLTVIFASAFFATHAFAADETQAALLAEAKVTEAQARTTALSKAPNGTVKSAEWRCCTDIGLAEGSPSPAVSGSHSWIADGVWPSGVQHAVEYRHTDGRLRALAGQTACAQARTDDGLVAVHRRLDK